MPKNPVQKKGNEFEHFTKADIQMTNKHIKRYSILLAMQI